MADTEACITESVVACDDVTAIEKKTTENGLEALKEATDSHKSKKQDEGVAHTEELGSTEKNTDTTEAQPGIKRKTEEETHEDEEVKKHKVSENTDELSHVTAPVTETGTEKNGCIAIVERAVNEKSDIPAETTVKTVEKTVSELEDTTAVESTAVETLS